MSEAEDVTRVDRGRAGIVVETRQDDRTEGTSCAHIEGISTREDSVDRQGRTAATEAVTAGTRREGGGERIERRRRNRAEEQRRVERHRDGLGGVTRQGQGTRRRRGQLVRSDPSSHPGVGTRGDERTRSIQGNGGRGRGASGGDFEDTRADGGRTRVGIGTAQDDTAIEALVSDRAGTRREVTNEEVRGDEVDIGEDRGDGQLSAASTEEVTIRARGDDTRVDGIHRGSEAEAVVARGHPEEGAAREVDIVRRVARQGERTNGSNGTNLT